MLSSLSTLSEKDLQEIHELEKQINSPLLAFSCRDTKVANLSKEQLMKIQELEKKLGVSLVAVSGSA